ncbi:MAG TPA: hypothetical protein VGC99_07405, partial [Candidatus Tectomicrobia bacterium]
PRSPHLGHVFLHVAPGFHWDHCVYCRWRVLVIAFAWGRRNVATLDRYIDAAHHRTRFQNCCLVARWDRAAARRQKAPERRRALHLRTGETIDGVIDASKKATRGRAMEAVAKTQEPTTEGSIRGHQSVCARLVVREQVIPWGIRLYVQPEHANALGLPCDTTTELAGQLSRELKPSVGVTVMVLCEASALCHTVVQAGREQHVHFDSTLKSQRSLFKQGWKLTAGRYGKHLFRRRCTLTRRLCARIQLRASWLLCHEALSQTSSRASLPNAASWSQHHARHGVVSPLTGRPTAKHIQTCSGVLGVAHSSRP